MTRLGIAAESLPDACLIERLVDRLLAEKIDWVVLESLDDHRTWAGLGGNEYLDVHGARELARERFGQAFYGHFQGEPGAHDALMYRAVFFLFADEDQRPSAVVIARDLDGDAERDRGFVQAVKERPYPFAVVGALAQPEIEAWLVAAWTPENPGEKKLLAEIRRDLGFNPTLRPEKLTSKNATDKKDAKRTLKKLCGAGRSGEDWWADVPLDRLRERGENCGLSVFLVEAEKKVVPLVSGT
ncbi:MAG: hypothetical protein AAB434_10765 [Planctomycetota bacterium]